MSLLDAYAVCRMTQAICMPVSQYEMAETCTGHFVGHSRSVREIPRLKRAKLIRHGQWSYVGLQSARGQCLVSLESLTCFEERRQITLKCATVDDVVGVALRFLEEGASFEELAADERVVRA